jgi:hypothetical protein
MMITQYLQYHAATLIDPASVGMSVSGTIKVRGSDDRQVQGDG